MTSPHPTLFIFLLSITLKLYSTMKSMILFLVILTTSFFLSRADAQTFQCDAFCVTNIQLNSAAPEIMTVTIFFTGNDNDFINYPYVSLVTDLHGDTLGTGTLNFFGQIANTSQDYEVNATLGTLPDSLMALVYFHFDTSVCVLNYPCMTSAVQKPDEFNDITMSPNPMATHSIISFDDTHTDLSVDVFNPHGQLVRRLNVLQNAKIVFERDGLPAGLYYFKIQ